MTDSGKYWKRQLVSQYEHEFLKLNIEIGCQAIEAIIYLVFWSIDQSIDI